jgi:hypothetical protein
MYLRAMQKNQKASPATDGYSKEEICPAGLRIYLTIDLWQESGLSRFKFVPVKTCR